MLQYAIKVLLTAVVVVAVSELAKRSSFWGAVLASLPLFLILPALLKNGVGFWPAFATSCVITIGLYFGMVWVLGRFGVRL